MAVAAVHRAGGAEPGVVDEHFHGEAALEQDVGEPTPRRGVGEVERDHLSAGAVGVVELGGELGEALLAPGQQGDAVPPPGELSGQVGADAR